MLLLDAVYLDGGWVCLGCASIELLGFCQSPWLSVLPGPVSWIGPVAGEEGGLCSVGIVAECCLLVGG